MVVQTSFLYNMYEDDIEVVDPDKIWGPQSDDGDDSINNSELDGIIESLPDGD